MSNTVTTHLPVRELPRYMNETKRMEREGKNRNTSVRFIRSYSRYLTYGQVVHAEEAETAEKRQHLWNRTITYTTDLL